MFNKKLFVIAVVAVFAALLAACAPGPAPTAETIIETVEVPVVETVEVQVEGETMILTATPAPVEDTGEVFILGAFRGVEEANFQAVIDAFEAENPDINVLYSGTAEFETLINVRVQAGDPPDITAVPQPGMMQGFAANGDIVPLPDDLVSAYADNYTQAWIDLASYEGTQYGVFHRVNAKGFVWYNKPLFEDAGWEVPTTWDELTALEDAMIADGTRAPWCVGIGSGAATGWVGTDWVETFLLRTQPIEVYDGFITGDVLFDSPEVREVWDIMDTRWNDEAYVYGGPAYIATTTFQDAAAELFAEDPGCWMHLQGSFATNFFPDDIKAALDENVGVYNMPKVDESLPTALEVGGDQFIAFNDKPSTIAFMSFLATGASANPWIEQGGSLFPHQDQDLSLYPTEIESTMAAAILTAELARFDASDAQSSECIPAFFRGVTDWIGGQSIDDTLTYLDEQCNP